MFGNHEAISTVWPLVSYLNSVVSFYWYLFRGLLCSLCKIKALYVVSQARPSHAARGSGEVPIVELF